MEPTTRRAVREFERSRAGKRARAGSPRGRGSARPDASTRPDASSPSARRAIEARRRRKSVGSHVLSLTAMLFAAALMIGTTIPANAFLSGQAVESGTPVLELLDPQTLAVDDEAVGSTTSRDAFTALSWAQVLTLKYGNRSYEYTTTSGTVRWPFPFASPISDGYGERVAPCYGCSTFHNGIDFTPGGGAPIYSIADGVVIHKEVSDYGLGNSVVIAHEINGERVESSYSHMQMNSSALEVGDKVLVGDFIGLVGDTGVATGNHLHFEIKVNGEYVDPFAWLTANAN